MIPKSTLEQFAEYPDCECLTWLSFADDSGFLGLVIAPTETIEEGVKWARTNNLNPGGEVMGNDRLYRNNAPDEFDIMKKYVGRLVSKDEALELVAILEKLSAGHVNNECESMLTLDEKMVQWIEEYEAGGGVVPELKIERLKALGKRASIDFTDFDNAAREVALRLENMLLEDEQ